MIKTAAFKEVVSLTAQGCIPGSDYTWNSIYSRLSPASPPSRSVKDVPSDPLVKFMQSM